MTQSSSYLLQLLEFVVKLVIALLDDFGLEVEIVVWSSVFETGWDEAREDVVRLGDHVVIECVILVDFIESLIRDHSDPFEV